MTENMMNSNHKDNRIYRDKFDDVFRKKLKDGEPCHHIGCLSHITHPCEGCGRIRGNLK